MSDYIQQILEEFKKAWKGETPVDRPWNAEFMKMHEQCGEWFESFLSQALTRIEEAAREEMIGKVKKDINDWIQTYAYLEDMPNHRHLFPEDTWYPTGKSDSRDNDPLRTVVSHVGLDQLRKLPSLASLSPQEEKISFEEGEKIVKKIQQKVESYRATPRYDQGGYHPSEDSVLACVCHCHNNVTHFPGGCMFCSCIHCKPLSESIHSKECDFIKPKEKVTDLSFQLTGMLMRMYTSKKHKETFYVSKISEELQKIIDKELSAQKERISKAIEGIRHEDRHYKFDSQGKKLVRLDDVLKLLEGDSK